MEADNLVCASIPGWNEYTGRYVVRVHGAEDTEQFDSFEDAKSRAAKLAENTANTVEVSYAMAAFRRREVKIVVNYDEYGDVRH